MTESQVSKSVSSTSQSQKDLAQLSQGKAGQLDGIFPLFDQMMQHAKLPAWFMSLVAVFMLCQMLSVGFWVYTPIYERVSGHWTRLYEVLLEIFTFQDTNDYSKPVFGTMGVSIGVAVFSMFWAFIMKMMNTKKYYIPVPYLYVSTVIIDVIDPLFMIPSAFVTNHGITGLNVEKNMNFVIEIIIGFIAYASLLFIFVLSTSLKTRSVVLSNLTFPLFDHFPITIWVSITSAFSIVSAILQFFDDWIYCIAGAIHILINVYVIYRMAFIPFYEVWRNAICMSFGFTAVALDINFYILYFAKLTYNYTIFVFIGVLIGGYILCRFYYIWKVNKIKKELTYSEEITNGQEYLSTLKFTGNPKRVMMYIVVGLARLCDFFIDGSLTDFVVNDGTLDSALSILLQIVTFFPSESRKMDVLYKKLTAKRKLSVTDRFLIYQVYRIKMRRLVSDTKDTLELYNKLKAKNDACKSIIKSFWDKQESNNAFLSSMSIMINDIDDYFKASLSANPNNLRFTNEYADFLAECKCDFDQAVKEKIKAESIGDGHNFNVDVSFRSVVNKFPRFLKDKILDTQGRRVKRTAHDKGSSSKESKSQASSKGTSNSSQSVDIERAEMVCKKILRDSKVRLAFHHSIMDTKPIQYKVIVGNIFMDVFVILFFYIGYFVFIRNSLKWRRSSYEDIANAAYAVFYAVYANVYTSSKFAVSTGRSSTSDAVLGNITIDKGNVITLLPTEWTLEHKIYYCLMESGNYLKKLLDNIAEIAQDNNNPYDYAYVFLRTTSQFKVCNLASPDYVIPCSLKVQIIVTNFMSNTIAGQYNQGWYTDNIYKSNDYCQILANLPILATNADIAFNSILNFNVKKASAYKPQIYAWMIAGALVIFITISTPAVIIIQTYNNMVDKLIKVLLALPQQVREEAKKPLMIDSDPIQDLSSNTKVATSNIMDILPRFFFLFLFICVGSYIGLCYTSIQLNDTMTKCLKWFYYSCTRITMSSQIGNAIIQIVMLNESLPNNITTRSTLLTKATSDLDKLIHTNKDLLYGNDDIPGIIGYDDTLDGLQIRNVCDLGRSPITLHDMYACSGLDQQFQMFKNMVTEVLRKPESFDGSLKGEIPANIAHNLRFHLYPNVMRATKRISDVMEHSYDKGMNLQIVFMAVGAVCLVVIFTLPWYFRDFVIQNYRVLLMMLQHLPPQTILDTPEIIEFFTGKKKKGDKDKMSTSKSIIHDASECIIITNQNSVIEIVNKSVTENIGLTPDQMLGQQIANFVSAKDQARLTSQIELMMSGQGSTFWEDHIELVNDNNASVPFSITMIGMKDNDNSSEIKSIVFILSNETEEIQKRADAEAAKAKSEKLLYQILPKSIVVRLNRGETDISFTIEAATIFFIDIVKFSAYTATLTPTEIMSNLSLVFATFDKIVSDYPSITKIKLIGDVYMAAAGLFQDEEEKSNKHAEDAVRCCIQCSKAMEEINMKLNASLEVRIGVNSGGPLIGGVLGTDKPTFDIIGDPINVAARLQSTDIPGCVQISSDTKALIENLDFTIEERGEIYLKGKGNRMTYFVSLQNKQDVEASFTMTLSSREPH